MTWRDSLRWSRALLALPWLSCAYDPELPSCRIACTSNADCPPELTCSAGRCGTSCDPGDSVTSQDVFVSSSRGAPDGDGTLARPLASLSAAFALAAQTPGRGVRACAEVYREALVLVDGVSARGHFDCSASWITSTKRAVVQSPTSPAATARDLKSPTRLEAFELVAPDLDGATSASSIGALVADSVGLALADVVVRAGKGAPGADGKLGATNTDSGRPFGESSVDQGRGCDDKIYLPGHGCSVRTRNPGGRGGTSACATGGAGGPGGDGGDGAWFNPGATTDPGRNAHGRPLPGTAATAAGGNPAAIGAFGTRGSDGADGANGAFSFDAGGFVPGDGTGGRNGGPGQGGGGGGGNEYYRCPGGGACSPVGGPGMSNYFWSASGGGGGAGGCGGLAGTAGTGGGASIGLLSLRSEVRLERARIESAAGGRAGKGSLGSAGLLGGASGGPTSWGGAGGRGGPGGTSGLSGHGAPGPSIALVYTGAQPDTVFVTLVPGPGGQGQPELRKPTATADKVLPAVAGVSLERRSF